MKPLEISDKKSFYDKLVWLELDVFVMKYLLLSFDYMFLASN
jgi:hypothetical protein